MNIEAVIEEIYLIIGTTASNRKDHENQIYAIKYQIERYCDSRSTGTTIGDDIDEVAAEIYTIIKPKVRTDERTQYLKQIQDIKTIIGNFCSSRSGPTGRIIGNTQVFTERGMYSPAAASMGVGPRRDNQLQSFRYGGRTRKRKRSRRYKRRR
jgi:hypothetical protein